MLTPSTIYPTPMPYNDLHQRIATRCFYNMTKGIKEHLAQSSPSRAELEDEVVLRAMEVLADKLRFLGRPDLADEVETLYYDALGSPVPGAS